MTCLRDAPGSRQELCRHTGVGYSQVIQPRDLSSHIKRMQTGGFPQYTVRPPGERPIYTSIIYLEPFSGRSLAAFGYDIMSESCQSHASACGNRHDHDRRQSETGAGNRWQGTGGLPDVCADIRDGPIFAGLKLSCIPRTTVGVPADWGRSISHGKSDNPGSGHSWIIETAILKAVSGDLRPGRLSLTHHLADAGDAQLAFSGNRTASPRRTGWNVCLFKPVRSDDLADKHGKCDPTMMLRTPRYFVFNSSLTD